MGLQTGGYLTCLACSGLSSVESNISCLDQMNLNKWHISHVFNGSCPMLWLPCVSSEFQWRNAEGMKDLTYFFLGGGLCSRASHPSSFNKTLKQHVWSSRYRVSPMSLFQAVGVLVGTVVKDSSAVFQYRSYKGNMIISHCFTWYVSFRLKWNPNSVWSLSNYTVDVAFRDMSLLSSLPP